MPLPVIADVHRVALDWQDSQSGFSATNVLHFKTAVAGRSPLQVYTCLNAHVTQAMWDWVSGTAIVTSVTITPLDGVSAAAVFNTGSPAKWTGGGLGQSIPAVAGLVKLLTGLRGPRHRGRIYVPFVGEGEQAGGQLIDVAAVTAAFQAFATACIADATTSMALGVASYVHSDWNQATTIVGETTVGTQRRRQRR
jgi:hypothetical protein